MRAAVLVLLVGGAAAVAQDATPGGDDAQVPKRLFVDAVVASVNDFAILQSRLSTLAAQRMRMAQLTEGRELSLQQLGAAMQADLEKLTQRYRMAQAAKSFSHLKPEQIEMILKSELDRDKQDRVREIGGVLAFSEELEREGSTWPIYRKEQRIDKLHDFARQFAVFERLRKQSTLYLTPRMLRETYEANRQYFVHDAESEVQLVHFTGTNAAANAQEASDLWKSGDWSAREVAERIPDSTPLAPILGSKLADPRLSEFAGKGPVGNVSPPVERPDGSFHVLKIMQFAPARNGRFADPDVQAEVRRIAEERVIREFEAQALERARQRTECHIYVGTEQLPWRR